MPPDAPGRYFIARVPGADVAAVGSQPDAGRSSAVWNTYVWVRSADEAAGSLVAAGGEVIAAPFEVMDAGRMAVCTDPEGAAFCVWEAREHRGARIVNEPGSLNFNGLNTRDPDAARAFYRSVFGWETLEMPGGGAAWRLPGYGDHLAQRDPGLRRADGSGARSGGIRGRRRDPESDRRRAARGTCALERDVRGRRCRRGRRPGLPARRSCHRAAVRRSVGTDDGDRRPARRCFIASKFAPENKDLAAAA